MVYFSASPECTACVVGVCKGREREFRARKNRARKEDIAQIFTCFINLARVLAIFFLHWMTAFPAIHLCVLVLGKQWKTVQEIGVENVHRAQIYLTAMRSHMFKVALFLYA